MVLQIVKQYGERGGEKNALVVFSHYEVKTT